MWSWVIVNVVGAALLLLMGWVSRAIHATHSISVNHELQSRAGLDGKKVTHLVEGDPRLPDGSYDTVERIRTTGNVESHLMKLCVASVVLLLANAAGWAVMAKKTAAIPPPARAGGERSA